MTPSLWIRSSQTDNCHTMLTEWLKEIKAVLAICFTACAQKKDKPNVSNTSSKTLVAYFSATGTTAQVARNIADITGGELFEIAPQSPYTEADLDWNNRQSRSSVEMDDAQSRPTLKATKTDIAGYDVVFIGYPIWWNLAPRIINTFIESHDLKGKTLIPFATSGGSSISNSVSELKKSYPSLNWKEGKLLNGMNNDAIQNWITNLNNQ